MRNSLLQIASGFSITCSSLRSIRRMALKYQDYPEFERGDDSTVLHGRSISDPYRWLEDPENEKTKEFVRKQVEITEPFINQYPAGEQVRARLTELYDYERFACPFKKGKYYYYFHNTGLQNQSVMYRTSALDDKAEVFLDPNLLSTDGTSSIGNYTFSESGHLMAYGVNEAGSDWSTISVMETETKEKLSDKLERVKFSCLSFTHDGKGFFYNKYPADGGKASGVSTMANKFHTLYYHRIGDDQTQDVVVAEFPDKPDYMGHVRVSRDGRYLFLSVSESCDSKCLLWYFDLENVNYEIKGKLDWVKVFDKMEAEYHYVHNWGTQVWFLTNKDAPKWKVVTLDLVDSSYTLSDVIPEAANTLTSVGAVAEGSLLYVEYIVDVVDRLYLYDTTTCQPVKELTSGIATISGKSSRHDSYEMFYRVTGFFTPGTIYRVDLKDTAFNSVLWREMKVKGVDQNDFVSQQVFYSSKDGTKVPMFINYKKDLDISSGKNPVLLYGYGGFNVAITPGFSPAQFLFMKHFNGVFCQPNIRGGSEYGEEWHKGGMVLNKQNVFDDFIHAAEYLVQEKYTQPQNITIQGGSNGGLLTAACMLQRPDLFGVVVCQVGVLDMVRFNKFTIGAAWQSDYGYPDDKKEHLDNVLKYSPLHNAKIPETCQLPLFLGVTADHDDRVSPLHTLKFVATIQHEANKCKDRQFNALLAMIDVKAGHGAGKPVTKVIDERARIASIYAQHLRLEYKP